MICFQPAAEMRDHAAEKGVPLMMLVRRHVLLFAACLGVSAIAAQAKPNFSGDWKLDTAKSDFGGFPGPSSMTQKISHEDPSLKIAAKMSTDNGDFDFESRYTTDGKESVNQFGPNSMKSTLTWEADVLLINSKGQFGDNEVTMKDKWELSGDGTTLTVSRHFSSSQGEMDQKLIFQKQ